MTQTFTTHSMLDDGQVIEISVGSTGVTFRQGTADSPRITMPKITISFKEAIAIMGAAFAEIPTKYKFEK